MKVSNPRGLKKGGRKPFNRGRNRQDIPIKKISELYVRIKNKKPKGRKFKIKKYESFK